MADNNHGGARKGAGRKPKTLEEEKIALICDIIPKTEIVELCAKQAKKGNMKAIELLMHYTLGKPKDIQVIEQSDSESIPVLTWVKRSE